MKTLKSPLTHFQDYKIFLQNNHLDIMKEKVNLKDRLSKAC
jgi:hypothetical protein